MSDDHANFDADRLNALKNNHMGFRWCPRCRTELVERELDGSQRMACPNEDCGFVYYQNPIPAAGAIIVEDNSVLMVKRAHPPRIGWWCLPAGYMEWNESPRQCAVRELKEETSLDVRLTELFEVYSGDDDPRTNAVLVLYLADIIGGTAEAGDDAMDVRFFPFDALPEHIAFEAHIQALADYHARHLEDPK